MDGDEFLDGLGLEERMDVHLRMVSRVREFVKERADLERDFARKLALLATKHTPALIKEDGGLEDGRTCGSAWRQIVDDTNESSKLHVHLADMLVRTIAEQLKTLKIRKENERTKTLGFVKEYIVACKSHADVAAFQSDYYGSCENVDAIKGRFERSLGEKARRKLKNAWHRSILDMNNSKNLYIMNLDMSNQMKKRHTVEIPIVLAQVSEFGTSTNESLVEIWTKYLDSHKEILRGQLDVVDGSLYALQSVNPTKGTEVVVSPEMLIPKLIDYEGCGLWTDKCKLVSDEYSVLFLRNKLTHLRKAATSIEQSVAKKQVGIEGLEKLYQSYLSNPLVGNSDSVKISITEESRQLFLLKQEQFKYQCLIDLSKVVGEFPASCQIHTFKSTLFVLPKRCGSCKHTIWAKTGLSCIECPYNAHSECEMKVNPTCSGLKIKRKTTPMPQEIIHQVPAVLVAPLLTRQPANDYKTAQVIYDFLATGPGEASVKEGDYVMVTSEDDGSGWTLVATPDQSGVIPTYALQW